MVEKHQSSVHGIELECLQIPKWLQQRCDSLPVHHLTQQWMDCEVDHWICETPLKLPKFKRIIILSERNVYKVCLRDELKKLSSHLLDDLSDYLIIYVHLKNFIFFTHHSFNGNT